jgi:hypothetical protein
MTSSGEMQTSPFTNESRRNGYENVNTAISEETLMAV